MTTYRSDGEWKGCPADPIGAHNFTHVGGRRVHRNAQVTDATGVAYEDLAVMVCTHCGNELVVSIYDRPVIA